MERANPRKQNHENRTVVRQDLAARRDRIDQLNTTTTQLNPTKK
jgi:hypothetical protein